MAYLLFSLSGCAIYSETRHKQALAAKDAWAKVDLAGQLSAARQQEAALLAEQLRTAEELRRVQRDALAVAMLLEDVPVSQSLLRRIDCDMLMQGGAACKVTAADVTAVRTYLDALDAQALAERNVQAKARELTRFSLEMPSCAAILDGSASAALQQWLDLHAGMQAGLVRAALQAADPDCRTLATRLAASDAALRNLPGGPLKTILGEAQQNAAALASANAAAANLRNSYRAAAAAYDSAAKELASHAPGAAARVDAALARLQNLMAQLKSLQDRLQDPITAKLLADARVASLQAIIASVEQARKSGVLAADAPRAARLLVLLPDLQDQASAALADARKPRLAPFLLMKELEKAKVDAASRELQSVQAIAALRADQLVLERQRLKALADGHDYLGSQCGGCLHWRLAAAIEPLTAAQLAAPGGQALAQAKANVLRAASLYLDSKGRLAASAQKIRYQITALQHERALANAEGNIAQWQTLISSVVGQMSDFGETGIRKEHIEALVGAVALLLISHGVN